MGSMITTKRFMGIKIYFDPDTGDFWPATLVGLALFPAVSWLQEKYAEFIQRRNLLNNQGGPYGHKNRADLHGRRDQGDVSSNAG